MSSFPPTQGLFHIVQATSVNTLKNRLEDFGPRHMVRECRPTFWRLTLSVDIILSANNKEQEQLTADIRQK